MNTYGLFSINSTTFNQRSDSTVTYPKGMRDIIVIGLKVHNLTLNILGYMPGFSSVSGCVRIGTGTAMCALAIYFGERNAATGFIIGHLYDETLLTGVTQIMRGAIEAFAPFSLLLNGSLDILGTFANITHACSNVEPVRGSDEAVVNAHLPRGVRPHEDPWIPFPFSLIDLA